MTEQRADVAIIGAGLAGLVAGALLSRDGRQVVILDPAPDVGGGGGATRTPDGYWVDFGHRDGRDVGDCMFGRPEHALAAASEVAAELKLAEIQHPWRVHRLPEGPAIERTSENFDAIARDILGCAHPEALQALMARWAQTPSEEARKLEATSMGDWLAQHVEDPELRTAALRSVTMLWHRHPERASVGRYIQMISGPDSGSYRPDDDEVGGMQGLMEPFARVARECGAEIALDCVPVEILHERGRAAGVIGVDACNVVRQVRAPVVIFTSAVWELFEILDDQVLPPALVADARELEGFNGDLIGWQVGLTRLPRLRSTGQPDHVDGWNRFLLGPECEYRGGYHIPSLTSRRAAPDGKHLLHLMMNRWATGGSRTSQPWQEGREALEQSADYLRSFYADFDECVEWTRHVYHAAPQAMTWLHATAPRHALEASGIEGLLLAGHTLDAPQSTGNIDIGAYAGRQAASRARELLG